MDHPISSIQPATKVRENFFDLINEVNKTNEGVLITLNNKPRGVLLSYDLFDSLMETIDILSDRDLVKELERARKSKDFVPFVISDYQVREKGKKYHVSNNHKKAGKTISSRKGKNDTGRNKK